MKFGSIVDTDEIEKTEWFRLDKIPLPEGKDPPRRHLQHLRTLLRSLMGKMEEIGDWLSEFEKSMQSAGLAKPLFSSDEAE